MEQPPPVPPPPPDQTPASRTVSNSKLYTILAWALGPSVVLSFVMIFVAGKAEPEAKFNAANATAVHGVMLAGSIVLQILTAAIGVFVVLHTIWYLIWFVVWVYGVLLAVQSEGQRFRFPVVTDTLAGLVTALEGLA